MAASGIVFVTAAAANAFSFASRVAARSARQATKLFGTARPSRPSARISSKVDRGSR
jgi:hypothetical protein